MSEKKRSRRRKEEYNGAGEQEKEKPSKDEYKVAKWMKKNVKTKKTKFLSHNVEYFTSGKAIDGLMKSHFAQGNEPIFSTREHAIDFLDLMLEHKFFHRAKKIPVTVEELRAIAGLKPLKKDKDDKEKSSKKDNNKDNKDTKDTEGEAEGSNGGENVENITDKEKKEKRKRKIRLDMHPEQVFVDGSEAYVWIYDPIPIQYWIYGLILLLGAIGICLFPLWPPMLRKGVYYLSMAAAGFLVFILVLTVLRLIIFTIIWALTGGKFQFWIFPNLTEDVGFFASFWPLYESKYVTDTDKNKLDKRSKNKSKKKEKDSDAEDDATAEDAPLEKIEEIKEHDADMGIRHRTTATTGDANGEGEGEESQSSGGDGDDSHSSAGDNSERATELDNKWSRTPTESESEIYGKDYEIINSSEVQNVK